MTQKISWQLSRSSLIVGKEQDEFFKDVRSGWYVKFPEELWSIYHIWWGQSSNVFTAEKFLGFDATTARARSGPCTIRDACIQSPNYPENYSQMLKSMVYNNTAVQEDEWSSAFIS